MNTKSTRGSEWRKWDMHLHSYFTYLNNNFSTISKEDYIQKIVDSDIKVVGLTNYFNFRNEDYELKKDLEEKGIIVFLNLELRLAYQNKDDDCCDFHIIFDNSLQEEQIKMLLNNLDVTLNGQTRKACLLESKSELENSVVELDTLIETLENASLNLKNKYLLGFLSRGKGNSRTSSVYAKIYEKTDFIIHSSDSEENLLHDREFWLQYKRPLLQSSDAHAENQIGNKFSWIKANTTFEGLKQIIYEPESRISLQIDKPEFKNDYQIIDSIVFNNGAMGNQKIEFNQNLNTIIGGRSSGKSILLGCLATNIDSNISAKENTSYNVKYNALVKSLSKSASVTWRDKTTKSRKIIYYSQSTISERVRPDEYGISGINELVQDIIKKDNDKSQELQKYDSVMGANRTEINTKINDFTELQNQIDDKNNQIADIGNKAGIVIEIEKIQNEIETIKKSIDGYLTDEEDKKYKRFKDQVVKSEQKIRLLKSDIDQLNIAMDTELFVSIDTLISTFSVDSKEEITSFYEALKTETKEKWINFINNLIELKKKELSDISEKMSEITNSELFKKGESFQSSNELLANKEKSLKEEKEKKYKIDKLEQEIKELNNAKKNCIESLWSLFEKYNSYTTYLANLLSIQKEEVEIQTKSTFLYKDFFEAALDALNRKEKNVKKYDIFEDKTNEERIKWVREIFDGIVNGKLPLKKDLRQTLINLFSNNYYKLSYDVTFDGDSFETMSEGKKAFIALRLLLDFDDSKCPIIIDQPEDDLDNRAIYDKLVEYLRKQKRNRQIILATHNPNVVVGADSELVIVANQNGIDSPNQDNLQFEYYGNSIEDTFENRECSTVLLSKGIREHICEILEGGTAAFQIREKKYGYNVN